LTISSSRPWRSRDNLALISRFFEVAPSILNGKNTVCSKMPLSGSLTGSKRPSKKTLFDYLYGRDMGIQGLKLDEAESV
jgi:hypothetical protein